MSMDADSQNSSVNSIKSQSLVQPEPSLVNSSINQASSTVDIPPNAAAPIRKRHLLKWIGIGALVLIVIGLFGGIAAFIFTEAPVKVANEQFMDIKQGRIQEAYDLFSPDAKIQVSFGTFQETAYVKSLRGVSDASIKFSSRSMVNATAEVVGTISRGNVSNPIRYVLIKQGNTWLIQNISFH